MLCPEQVRVDQFTPFKDQINRRDFTFKRELREDRRKKTKVTARKSSNDGRIHQKYALELKLRQQIDSYFKKIKKDTIKKRKTTWENSHRSFESSCSSCSRDPKGDHQNFIQKHAKCNHYRNRLIEFNCLCLNGKGYLPDEIVSSREHSLRRNDNCCKCHSAEERRNSNQPSCRCASDYQAPAFYPEEVGDSGRRSKQGQQKHPDQTRAQQLTHDVIKNELPRSNKVDEDVSDLIEDMQTEIEALTKDLEFRDQKYRRLKKEYKELKNQKINNAVNQNDNVDEKAPFTKEIKEHLKRVDWVIKDLIQEVNSKESRIKKLLKSTNSSPLEDDEIDPSLVNLVENTLRENSSLVEKIGTLCKVDSKYRVNDVIEEKLNEDSIPLDFTEKLAHLENEVDSITSRIHEFNNTIYSIDPALTDSPKQFSIANAENLFDRVARRLHNSLEQNAEAGDFSAKINSLNQEIIALRSEAQLNDSDIKKYCKLLSSKGETVHDLISQVKVIVDDNEYLKAKNLQLNEENTSLKISIIETSKAIDRFKTENQSLNDQITLQSIKLKNEVKFSSGVKSDYETDSIRRELFQVKQENLHLNESINKMERTSLNKTQIQDTTNSDENEQEHLRWVIEQLSLIILSKDPKVHFDDRTRKLINNIFGKDKAKLVLNYEKVVSMFKTKCLLVEEIYKERLIRDHVNMTQAKKYLDSYADLQLAIELLIRDRLTINTAALSRLTSKFTSLAVLKSLTKEIDSCIKVNKDLMVGNNDLLKEVEKEVTIEDPTELWNEDNFNFIDKRELAPDAGDLHAFSKTLLERQQSLSEFLKKMLSDNKKLSADVIEPSRDVPVEVVELNEPKILGTKAQELKSPRMKAPQPIPVESKVPEKLPEEIKVPNTRALGAKAADTKPSASRLGFYVPGVAEKETAELLPPPPPKLTEVESFMKDRPTTVSRAEDEEKDEEAHFHSGFNRREYLNMMYMQANMIERLSNSGMSDDE